MIESLYNDKCYLCGWNTPLPLPPKPEINIKYSNTILVTCLTRGCMH